MIFEFFVPGIPQILRNAGADYAIFDMEHGGLGFSAQAQSQVVSKIASRSVAAGITVMVPNSLGPGELLEKYGTPEQSRFFCPRILAGEIFFAIGYSEPGAGTDLASLTTTAVRDGGEWVINGQKMWTSLAEYADYIWLAARTDPKSTRHHGISVFCLPLDAPGVTMTPMWNLGGGRQNHTYLDNVRVPHELMIGTEGQGWHYIMNAFYAGGFGAGAMHAGYQRMFDEVFEYCRTTRRGGRPLRLPRATRSRASGG